VPLKVIQMITQTARKISILALTLTLLGMVSACSTQAVVQEPDRSPAKQPIARSPGMGSRAAAIALQQVGVPYVYGGSTTSGFDCSGLVQYSYSRAGKSVPRTTSQLWSATSTVRREDLQVGDLLFFKIEGKMSHVGMYIGDQRFVHAPSSGRAVTIGRLSSPYYTSAFIRAGRPK
jgi:cell wall-associated NlpC family hydrolase